jgi:hypothetical protein
VATLVVKLKRARDGCATMKPQYNDLTAISNTKSLEVWLQEAKHAEDARGEALKSYDVKMDKGSWSIIVKFNQLTIRHFSTFYGRNPTSYDRARAQERNKDRQH